MGIDITAGPSFGIVAEVTKGILKSAKNLLAKYQEVDPDYADAELFQELNSIFYYKGVTVQGSYDENTSKAYVLISLKDHNSPDVDKHESIAPYKLENQPLQAVSEETRETFNTVREAFGISKNQVGWYNYKIVW